MNFLTDYSHNTIKAQQAKRQVYEYTVWRFYKIYLLMFYWWNNSSLCG